MVDEVQRDHWHRLFSMAAKIDDREREGFKSDNLRPITCPDRISAARNFLAGQTDREAMLRDAKLIAATMTKQDVETFIIQLGFAMHQAAMK